MSNSLFLITAGVVLGSFLVFIAIRTIWLDGRADLKYVIKKLGHDRVLTFEQSASGWQMNNRSEDLGIGYRRKDILRCAEGNAKKGDNWLGAYFFSNSAVFEIIGKWHLPEESYFGFNKSSESRSRLRVWENRAPCTGFYLVNFKNQFFDKIQKEQRCSDYSLKFERAHELIFAYFIICFSSQGKENYFLGWKQKNAQPIWHWGTTLDMKDGNVAIAIVDGLTCNLPFFLVGLNPVYQASENYSAIIAIPNK